MSTYKVKTQLQSSKKPMSLTNIRGESGYLFKRVFTLVISNSDFSLETSIFI